MHEAKLLLGRRIRQLRRYINLTQAQLAEKTGLSTNYISQIETAVASPSFETLVKIANGLEVELKNLFDFSSLSKQKET